MKLTKPLFHALFGLWLAVLLLAAPPARAALTDLATSPLETSTATLVKPNIFYVLDDSASMGYDYLPDWVALELFATIDSLRLNARFNGLAYDPAVVYTPPLRYDGSSYPLMTSSNTSSFTRIPMDGYGVQTTATSSMLLGATYWTFVAGEYCSAPNLRTCVAQSAPSTAYPYPAYLRWCTNALQNNCQATRIEGSYTTARYPGLGLNLGLVPGRNLSTVIIFLNNSYVYPGTNAKAPTRTDCAANICTYNEEMGNYANWQAYYRTRMQATKTAISQAFNVIDDGYRIGFMTINNTTGADFLNVADNPAGTLTQKQNWYTRLFAARPGGLTPLKKGLATAGRYYAGNSTRINNQTVVDPIQYACQRNYTMLSTDGYWNDTTTPQQVTNTAIGNQDGNEVRPYLDGNNTSNTLADIAQYYYATDLRSSGLGNATNATGVDVSSNNYSNGRQNMNTYTIGLGASGYMQYLPGYATAASGDYFDVANGTVTNSGTQAAGVCIWQASGACNWPVPTSNAQTTIDDLWHAAVNGRGTYYSVRNATELKSGLTDFLNNVNAVSSSSASATTSSSKLVRDGNNFAFGAKFCSAKWFGELARYNVDSATGAASGTATWSQSGASDDCDTAGAATTTPPLLDNRAWATRNIYTYDGNTTGTLTQFQWSSMSNTLKSYFQIAAIGGLSQICTSGTGCLTAASQVDSTTTGTTTGAGGINLVNFLRGDRSNEGNTTSDYYFPRTHVLGDIVNSQPVYVQTPKSNYADTGYAAFKAAQATRQGMVYVGANDGMVHAFNADTGAEVWAYIPSVLLPRLYKLADKNYPVTHQNFVDGSLIQDDIYVNGAWRTVLVGGLGGGGRGFYALDITSPTAPALLWEFTSDTRPAPYITDADLGYSFGRPYVGKLADGTWVVLVSSGYNNVSPGTGRGYLWVLNARTGAIIRKIDTGVGSATAAVTGCTVAPCPSGLSKFIAFVDYAQNNVLTQVYGGDLFGNLWRFDLTALTGSGTGATPVQLMATLADASGNRQPITSRPEIGTPNGVRVLYVGTGAYLGVSDISTTRQQTFYAIKDPLTTSAAATGIHGSPRTNTCSTTVASTACFMRQTIAATGSGTYVATSTASYSWTLATMNGWYIDLPVAGERQDTDMVLTSGTLAANINSPSTAGACSIGGYAYGLTLDYRTGSTVPGATNVGVLLSASGLASSPTLVQTASGTLVAITRLSDGTTVTNPVPVAGVSTGTRRISWRRLTDSQ